MEFGHCEELRALAVYNYTTTLKVGRERLRPNRAARVTRALRVSPRDILLHALAGLHRPCVDGTLSRAARGLTGNRLEAYFTLAFGVSSEVPGSASGRYCPSSATARERKVSGFQPG